MAIKNRKEKGPTNVGVKPRRKRARKPDNHQIKETTAPPAPPVQDLEEWQTLMVEWLNETPQRTAPSVVLPSQPYLDRTIVDRQRFMERARPKITKDVLKQIIRGDNDVFRDCLVSTDYDLVYVPSNLNWMGGAGGFTEGEIDVPIGVDEPNWWPGRDKPGGG
jgi:hypothetical protein